MIRAGFGVFVASIGTQGINQPGFSAAAPGPRLRHHRQPAARSDARQSVPDRAFSSPPAPSPGLGTFLGQSITFYNPNPLNPYSIRWNFDIQRQIGKGMVFEIGYTGNHAVHLPIDQNLELHAGAVSEHVAVPRPGGDRPQLEQRAESVRRPAARARI